MKRFITLLIVGLFLMGGMAYSQEYVPQNVSPTGALDWMVYDLTDALGDVISSVPLVNPGTNNAYNGSAWNGGYIYIVKNVQTPMATHICKIDPATGTILADNTVINNAYGMGLAWDGQYFWLAIWSPSNVIYKLSSTFSIVSQFTPSTSPYSCRAVNYEAGNLWVGANYGSSDTKLYKMSTAGTIIQQWMTGSVVGWYMGGDVCTEAPAGQNLFFVDNVGNTLKRLSVSGTTVTIMDQAASPAVSPDLAEGLAFDGQFLWHHGAFGYNGLMKVDDGVVGTPQDVEVNLTPYGLPIQIPGGGGTFEFNIEVINNETSIVSCQVWTLVTLPSGSNYGPIIFTSLNLPVGFEGDRDRTQNVPASAPTGNYVYHAYVGGYPSTIWDEDSFPFSKLAVDNGGPVVPDWSNWGESFEDWLTGASLAAPEKYELFSAYPNPFNPDTKLGFALKEAGNVTMKIYNIRGEEVATIVDGYLTQGVHEYLFNGKNLASGIYLYSIKANGFQDVKKMMLLK